MKYTIASLVFMMTLVPACASDVRFYPVTMLKNEPLSPRPHPAMATTEPGDALRAQGYATIGWIGTAPTVTACVGLACKSLACAPTGTAPAKLADDILAAAAKQGGDLVDLRLGAAALNAVPQGWPKCRKMGAAFEHRGGDHAAGDSGTWGWFPRCVEWSRLSDGECIAYSGGTVWRRDPDMALRVAAAEREVLELEAERVRLMSEAIKTRELYGALYASYMTNSLRYDDLLSYASGGRFGFRGKDGVTIIEPRFTDALPGFSEGVAAVADTVKGRKRWGFIDRTGAWVIAPRYDRVSDFSEGLAAAEEDGRAGFIDRSGMFVIKPVFDRASSFRIGIAEVWINNKSGFYDRSIRKLFTTP